MSPSAILVIQNGMTRLVNIRHQDAMTKALDMVPDLVNRFVGGKDISKMKPDELTIFRRRRIGFVFQNYNLVPILNVYENIILPIELDGNRPDKGYIDNIITLLGLEKKLTSMPNNLSGGQQQRVAIARALATKPAIILADVN